MRLSPSADRPGLGSRSDEVVPSGEPATGGTTAGEASVSSGCRGEPSDDVALELVRSAVRRSCHRFSGLVLCAADLLGLLAAVAIAHGARVVTGGHLTWEQIGALMPLPLLLLAFLIPAKGYALTPPHAAEELRRLTVAITLTFLILVGSTFFLRTGETFSRAALLGSWLLAMLFIPLVRSLARDLLARSPRWRAPVVICGAGATGAQAVAALQRSPSCGLDPVIILDDDPRKVGTRLSGIPVAGPLMEVGSRCAELGACHLLLAMPGASPDHLWAVWNRLGPLYPVVMAIPGTTGAVSIWVEAKDLGGHLGLELQQSLLRPSRRLLKRVLDILLVLAGSVVVVPLILVVTLLVRCSSRGPIFYSQQRVGRGGRAFSIWKFRTMRTDAEQILAKVLAEDAERRAEWERDHKLRRDPRVTLIGNLLRQTSLDELPQIWNVLIGQMSLVGPRPVTEAEAFRYREQWDIYLRVRPGLTGLWQVSRTAQTTYDQRVAMDVYYIHNWSPWFDLIILGRTCRAVLRREGAY